MKRTPFRNFALLCLALALIISACGAPLKITITSALLSDTSDYVLEGNVDNRDLIATITYSLNGAEPEPLQLNGNEFSKLIYLEPGANTIRVVVTATGGQVFTEDVTVTYTATGADPVGDQVGGDGPDNYDVVLASASVDAGLLTVRIELTSSPDIGDPGVGGEFAGVVLLDLTPDQGASYEDARAAVPCEMPLDIREIFDYTIDMMDYEAEDWYDVTDMIGDADFTLTPTVDENVLTLTGTAPAGIANGAVTFFGFVGNSGGPTDCFPSASPPVY